MTTATNIQENTEDILAEAKEINTRRREEVFGDEGAESAADFIEIEAADPSRNADL